MIKRQFYAIEHADNGDDASSSSSSSSSSSLNTSSDLSSAAEDEQDDGAWPGIIEAMTVSVSFWQSLVCVCVCVCVCCAESLSTERVFYGGELVVEGLEMLTRVFFGGRFVFDVSEMLAEVFLVEDLLLRSWMVVFFRKENPLLLPLAVEVSFVCHVATASSHESDESLREEEEGEEAGSGAQLAPLHTLLVPILLLHSY
jgi:hypothetical protein